MSDPANIDRPVLAPHARFRWDQVRRQHQIVYPEGVLILNETGAAIVERCDGRTRVELIAELEEKFGVGDVSAHVQEFLTTLQRKGLLRDGSDDS